jgi:glycosyltransferase involved in cell wall biosynthesis
MRLLIVSHVVHYQRSDGYYAYAPYAKEIELWADLFPEIVIAAPCRNQVPPPGTCIIGRTNVQVAPQREVGGTTWRHKAAILPVLPALIAALSCEMWRADAIHIRCPGNLGLLGVLLAPLFSNRLIAKYAGQWSRYPGEAWTVRLQRLILRSRWWRGPVTVYGKQPGEPLHVVDFFSSMFTTEQLSRARARCLARRLQPPLTAVYVGRLTTSKNVDVLVRAIAALKAEGLCLRGLVVGDGPQRDSLRQLAARLGVADQVDFTGAVPPERMPELLERCDIFVLVSETEGWPKAVAEAMAFGLICIASDRGLIPSFLSDGRGLTVPPRDLRALTGAVRAIGSAPAEYQGMRERASEWAQKYSLENLRDALRDLLAERWHLSDGHFRAPVKPAMIE